VNPHGNMPPPSAASATISWNPRSFSAEGFYILREGYEGNGAVVVSDMRTTTEYKITGEDQFQYFTVEYGLAVCVNLDLATGWNLVSLPVVPEDNRLVTMFPEAIVAYKFEASYETSTELEAGVGYWVKIPDAKTYTICGENFPGYSATLAAGWHLVGTCNGEAVPTSDPHDAVQVLYGFDGSYYTTSGFECGRGYWVKTNKPCSFTVECE